MEKPGPLLKSAIYEDVWRKLFRFFCFERSVGPFIGDGFRTDFFKKLWRAMIPAPDFEFFTLDG